MQYVLMFQQPKAEFEKMNNPAEAPAYWEAWSSYLGAMKEAGVIRGGEGLQPPHTATTVRIKDGKRHIQDGPFADTRELVGGFMVIEVPSLEEALQWAARSPSSQSGSTEVRPVLPPPSSARRTA